MASWGVENRKFLTAPPSLEYKLYADDEPSFDLKLIGSGKERAFPSRLGLDLAISKLREETKSSPLKKRNEQNDKVYKQHAYRFIAAQLKMHLGQEPLPEDLSQLVRLSATDLLENKYQNGSDIFEGSDRARSGVKHDAQEDTLKRLLMALIYATTIPDLQVQANALLQDVCRHFAILELGRALAGAKHKNKAFSVSAGEGSLYLDSRLLADAIVGSLADDDKNVQEAAETVVEKMFEASGTMIGDGDRADRLYFFMHLANVFCHCCYEEEWLKKAGGQHGIQLMASKLPMSTAFVQMKQMDFVRALLFTIKDMPEVLPIVTRVKAQDTLEAILRRCNAGAQSSDLENEKSKFYQLSHLLCMELFHSNRHVRECARHALGVLAECASCKVWELVKPWKDRVMLPIYNKPLRALPFAIQIAYIDCMSFFLSLGHDLVDAGESLNRFLTETFGSGRRGRRGARYEADGVPPCPAHHQPSSCKHQAPLAVSLRPGSQRSNTTCSAQSYRQCLLQDAVSR